MIVISTIIASIVVALIMWATIYAVSSKPDVHEHMPTLDKEQLLKRAYRNAYYAHMSISLEETQDQSIENDA